MHIISFVIIITHINQTLKDWMLALLVAVFVSIDIFILVVYTVVEAAHGRLNAVLMPNDEHAITLAGVSQLLSNIIIKIHT